MNYGSNESIIIDRTATIKFSCCVFISLDSYVFSFITAKLYKSCKEYLHGMLAHKKHQLSGKIWIEHNGKPLLGKGGAKILQGLADEKSISKAALKLGMSYRYVWNYIKKIESIIGEPVVETYKGGKHGGGGAKLTELGQDLLTEYRQLEDYLSEILSDAKNLEVKRLKISARNRLKGKVISVEKDQINGKVKIEIKAPSVITAVITREAIEDLDIKVGDEVEAIIKSSEVIVGK